MDNILNEFIKFPNDNMISVYTRYFNVILQTDIVPNSWTKGLLIPNYKKER